MNSKKTIILTVPVKLTWESVVNTRNGVPIARFFTADASKDRRVHIDMENRRSGLNI